jgi:hypothetical protein
MKLIISYSHLDAEFIDAFKKHMTPLRDNKLITIWSDREIIPGQDFQETIDNQLESADIICLFLSANFFDSTACKNERDKAFDLINSDGIRVIPIIIKHCAWLDDKKISKRIALPKDGTPVETSQNDKSWQEVYQGIKKVIENINKIKSVKINKNFQKFIESIDLLSNAHAQKNKLLNLEEIFVYPDLDFYEDLREYRSRLNSEKMINEIFNYSNIIIAGEDLSGKTTLCKKIFIDLFGRNFFPIYLSGSNKNLKGNLNENILNAFNEQYDSINFEDIDITRIIPIIDDFHFAKHKEKIITDLSNYHNKILLVDDIFCLDIKEESLIKSFNKFRIKEFYPTLRCALIKKWILINENDNNQSTNDIYKGLDSRIEFVDNTLGKVFSKGIMPSYPFFILSIISTESIDKEISNQGYCYQALIYMYLRNYGVKIDDVDTYLNFLTEFSFFLFTEKKKEINNNEFKKFITDYKLRFNLPIKDEILLKTLAETKLINFDSFGNYSFCYIYLYYFFVAKYLAEHLNENKRIIDNILGNLHKNDSAYIAIFICHHTVNEYLLEELILNAQCLNENYLPSTLNTKELYFFDDKLNHIIQAVLPKEITTPEIERAKLLKSKDDIEELNSDKVQNENDESNENKHTFPNELRRSIRTVEVMGLIMKNRAGSLQKVKLESILIDAIMAHLRLITLFFEMIKSDEDQIEIIEYIKKRINKLYENESKKKSSQAVLEKNARIIFWNINFFIIYGLINKLIHSIGSDKLLDIVDSVCNEINTTASFLIKQGVFMWFNKNIQIDEIVKEFSKNSFSETAKRIMKFMIVNYSSIHEINFRDKQKIENKLGFVKNTLLIESYKKH